MNFNVGDRVRVTEDFNRNTLPLGTTGTVTATIPGLDGALFFTADDGQDLPYGSAFSGYGYPLFADELALIEESVDA